MASITRSKVFVLAKRTIQEFMDDQCMHLAGAIAYFGFLSLFPLILFIIALFGQYLQTPATRDQILNQVGNYLPGATNFVLATIEGVVEARGAIGVISALTLLWTAGGVFGATTQAINYAWDIKSGRPLIQQNLLNLGLAIASGVVLLMSIGLTGSFHFLTGIAAPLISFFPMNLLWGFIGIALPFFFSLGIFVLIYKILPNTEVKWREALVGAVVAAILFETVKNLFAWYTQNLANYNAVYGAVGTVAILLTWIYFSSAILLLGAELSSVVAQQDRQPSGVPPVRRPVQIKETARVRAQRNPSPVLAAALGIVTVGLVAFRAIISFRSEGSGKKGGPFRFLKQKGSAR